MFQKTWGVNRRTVPFAGCEGRRRGAVCGGLSVHTHVRGRIWVELPYHDCDLVHLP